MEKESNPAEFRRLEPRQEAFCQEYVKDFNATKAAIRAGYSPKTARQIGSQNLSKLNISRKIEELRTAFTQKIGINTQWIVQQVLKLAECGMEKYPNKTQGLTMNNPRVALQALKLLSKYTGGFDKGRKGRENIGRPLENVKLQSYDVDAAYRKRLATISQASNA